MASPVTDSSDDGKAYGFSARDSERIATATRRIEAKYQNELPERRRGPVFTGGVLIRVQLPTGIGSGTLAAPAVKLDCIILKRDGEAYTTDGGQQGQTIYNYDTAAVTGTNKSAWAVHREGGGLELVIGDC